MTPWTLEQKLRLLAIVERHQVNGRVGWAAVAAEMGSKTASQCKSQFIKVLKARTQPVVQKWTQLETAALVVAVEQ